MPSGTLIQLYAINEENDTIIGNPEITFFKFVYKTHTNFSICDITQRFNEKPAFGKKTTCTIEKKGDLLANAVLYIELPELAPNVSWINGIGHHIIEYIELQMGGITICRLTGEYIDIYSELSLRDKDGYYKMVGKSSSYSRTIATGAKVLFVPLPFWFCMSYASAIPLISLGHMDVNFVAKFRDFAQCWYSGTEMSITPPSREMGECNLICRYIYLAEHERRKFLKAEKHTYLIEQVQYDFGNVGVGRRNAVINYKFSHPVKELYFIYQANAVELTNDWGNYSRTLDDDTVIQTQIAPFVKCRFLFNGIERTEEHRADYFRYLQPYLNGEFIQPATFVYCHSYCLHPLNMQPSGVCNYSVLESAQLQLTFDDSIYEGICKIYARSYNVLMIKAGMAGLMYSM